MTDHDVAVAMVNYGGGFVSALGSLWWKADEDNRARMKAAWPEYWAKYAELAALHQARERRPAQGDDWNGVPV